MTTTIVKNGQLITSTATEQDLQPEGPFYEGVVLMQAEVVSGTIQVGVGPSGGSPVIGGAIEFGSYDTGDKALRSVDPGISNLRVAGVGTCIVSW